MDKIPAKVKVKRDQSIFIQIVGRCWTNPEKLYI